MASSPTLARRDYTNCPDCGRSLKVKRLNGHRRKHCPNRVAAPPPQALEPSRLFRSGLTQAYEGSPTFK